MGISQRAYTATDFDPEVAEEFRKLANFKVHYIEVVDDNLIFKSSEIGRLIKKLHFGQIANVGVISAERIVYFVG